MNFFHRRALQKTAGVLNSTAPKISTFDEPDNNFFIADDDDSGDIAQAHLKIENEGTSCDKERIAAQSETIFQSSHNSKSISKPPKHKIFKKAKKIISDSFNQNHFVNEKKIRKFTVIHDDSLIEKSFFQHCWEKFKHPASALFKIFELQLLFLFIYYLFHFSLVQMNAVSIVVSDVFSLRLPGWQHFLATSVDSNCSSCFVCELCKSIYVCKSRHRCYLCGKCQKDITKSHFHYYSSIDWLKQNLFLKENVLNTDFIELLSHYKRHNRKKGHYSDIYDGKIFRKFKKTFFRNEKDNEISLCWIMNDDGFATSQKLSEHPFFLNCANVPRSHRRNPRFNPLVALANDNLSTTCFDAVFFMITSDLLKFYKGFEIGGITFKGYVICCMTDLPARADMIKQKRCNGYNSCCFCGIVGAPVRNPHTASRNKKKKSKKKTKAQVRFPHHLPQRMRSKGSIINDIKNCRNGFQCGYSQLFRFIRFSFCVFFLFILKIFLLFSKFFDFILSTG